MQASDEPITDFRSEFLRLADIFQRIEEEILRSESPSGADKPSIESPESPNWGEYSFGQELVKSHSLQRKISEYREAVSSAGCLCADGYRAGLLNGVDGLAELTAGMELHRWGDLTHSHANLFALLAGGSQIELEADGGLTIVVEKPKPGWPIQYVPVRMQEPSAAFVQTLGLDLPPDSTQCHHYANFCRSLAKLFQVSVDVAIPPRAMKAHAQYEYACQVEKGRNLKDDEAYALIASAYNVPNEKARKRMQDEFGELPKCQTWKRNLREYRKLTQTNKNQPRSGRQNATRSIVLQKDV